MKSMLFEKGKTFKKTVLKALSFLLVLGIFTGSFFSQTVNAEMIDDGLNEKNGTEELAKLCEEINLWREVIEDLPAKRPEFLKSYTFWWGNLDDESNRELIVRITKTQPDQAYVQELLLVYDMKEEDGEMVPELLFETEPYVPIRSGFSGSADGKGMTFNAVVAIYKGDCVEGTVKLNSDRTDLEYTVLRTYSMANNEKASEGNIDISGYYNADNQSQTDWGSLSLDKIVDHDFKLGKDNNGFTHTIIPEDERSGFVGLTEYSISAEQKEALFKGESKGTIAEIKDHLEGEFGGVCLGLTTMISLAKQGSIALSDYDEDAKTFYEVGKPNENNKLFQELCYLNMVQFLLDDEDYDGFVEFKKKNSQEQFKELIKAVNPDKWQILSFITKKSGHALLIKSLTYFKSLGLYDMEIYDINSLSDKDIHGRFFHMYVKDDFSAFVLTDSNGEESGETINQDNCIELSLISADTLLHEKSVEKKEEDNKEKKTLSFDAAISRMSYTDSQGNEILYQDGQITGGDNIISIPGIVTELDGTTGKVYQRIEIPDSETYTFQCDPTGIDVRINTGNEYYSLQGQGINTVVFSKENGIQITGEEYTFTAGQLINGNEEHLLIQTVGSGSGTVNLQDVEGTLKVSSETPVTIDHLSAVHDTETIQYPVGKKTTDLTLSQDGTLYVESSGSMIWIFVIVGLILVALLAVLLTVWLKRRKKVNQ